MRRRNRVVLAECERILAPALIRRYRLGLVASGIAAEVEHHAALLAPMLREAVAA
jgi:hypothetical protein